MAYAAWQIKNLILMEISHDTIPESEWSNPSTTNTDIPIMNAQYDLAVPIALTMHRWTFAQKFAQIALADNTGANTKFTKVGTLPTDMLGYLYVYANDKRSLIQSNYEVIGNQIYAMMTPLYIQYLYLVPEANWPQYFVDWVKTFIAARVNSYLNGDVQREALLKNNEVVLFRTAKSIDGKINPNESVPWNPFLASRGRFGGGNIA